MRIRRRRRTPSFIYINSFLDHDVFQDAFDLESYRQSRTVVVANIAPSVVDISMTLNTLRYAGPIKQGLKNKVREEVDMRNPKHWSNEMLTDWMNKTWNYYDKKIYKSIDDRTVARYVQTRRHVVIDPKIICPWESGRQFLSLSESEIISRITTNHPGVSEERGKECYMSLWKVFVDARTHERKMKMKPARKQLGKPLKVRTESKNDTQEL